MKEERKEKKELERKKNRVGGGWMRRRKSYGCAAMTIVCGVSEIIDCVCVYECVTKWVMKPD